MKKTILVVILLVVALAVALGLYSMVSNATAPEEMVMVAVAKGDIAEGTFLTSSMYEYKAIPKTEYIPTYVTMQSREILDSKGAVTVEQYDSLKGKEVKSPMYEGERLIKARINFSNEMTDEEEFSNKLFKRYTYSGSGLNNFAGLLKSGDRVDIWVQYTISSKDDEANAKQADKIIVTDRIFSNVLISRVLDETGAEVTTSSGGASVLEFMLTDQDIQKFISWRAIGTVTLVKSGSSETPTNIDRRVISMNDLINDVVSSAENNSLLDENTAYEIDNSINDLNS